MLYYSARQNTTFESQSVRCSVVIASIVIHRNTFIQFKLTSTCHKMHPNTTRSDEPNPSTSPTATGTSC